MAKSTKRKTDGAVTGTAGRAAKRSIEGTVDINENDIARRAYDLYRARGCEPGRHLEDWLQAERELRHTSALSTV